MLFIRISRSRGFRGNLRGPRSAPSRHRRLTNSSGAIMARARLAGSRAGLPGAPGHPGRNWLTAVRGRVLFIDGGIVATWSAFCESAPELSQLGEKRLFQFGPGLAFLATVRGDGGPRVHPVCVNVVDGDLYLLIGPSPKRGDLVRDARFALHSFPAPDIDDEFYLTGMAHPVAERASVARVEAAQVARGATTSGDETAFRLDIERALYSRYKPRGEPDNWPPEYLKWSAGEEWAT